MHHRWRPVRVAAFGIVLLVMVFLVQEAAARVNLLEELPQIEKWTRPGANIGSILVSLSVVFGGIVSFRKYVGTQFLQPTTIIELDLDLTPMGQYSLITVNVKIANRGVRTIVIRGDGTREKGSIISYVGAVTLSDTDVTRGQLTWKADDEVGYLLDEQDRGLWVNGVRPAEHARKFRQELAPAQQTALPFLIRVSPDTVAARVRAQIYIEDKRGRNSDYVQVDRVVHTTEGDRPKG